MLRMKFMFGVAMLAAAFCASAQSGYRGTFNLPFETYWAGTVLQPGEYTVSIVENQPGQPLLRIRGNGTIATVLTGPVERTAYADHGRLVISNANGVSVVKQFDTGAAGKSFTFSVPKAARGEHASTAGAAAETEVGVR